MGLVTLPHTIKAGQTALASEVQENFEAIVTVVNGGIQTVNITDNAVTQAKIADSAVGEAQIASSAVTAAKIATGAVTETKLDNSAVTANKLANNAVTTAKINNDAVTADKLGSGAVTTTKLATSAVEYVTGTLVPQYGKVRFYVLKYVLGLGGVVVPSGWSVSRSTEGVYVVTHNLGHTSYAPIFAPYGANAYHAISTSNQSTSTITVRTYFENPSTSKIEAADADFAMIVMVFA